MDPQSSPQSDARVRELVVEARTMFPTSCLSASELERLARSALIPELEAHIREQLTEIGSIVGRGAS